MNEAIALAEEISGRALDVERVEAAAGDVKRTKADVSKAAADLGWAPETALRDGLAAQWEWASPADRVARVSTPVDPDAEREVDLRSVWERIAARWWLPVLGTVLGLVIGFALALGGGKVYEAETLIADGPAVLAERRRARRELPHERTRGRRDHPLRGGAREGREGVRAARARAPRQRHLRDRGRERPRRPADRSAAGDDQGRGRAAAEGGEGGRRARRGGDRADGGAVRRHEDQGVQRPARVDPGAAEHARAADRPAGGGGDGRAGSPRSTSSSSSARWTTRRRGAASCSTSSPTSSSSSRSPRTSRRRR